MQPYIEIIAPPESRAFRYAVLDFDGTISLIREGWQQIMTPYFTDELLAAPGAKDFSREEIALRVREFITLLTGKQTIYQCIRLAEEIRALGGTPLDPQAYKDEYHRRLLERIDHRLRGLENGGIDPETLTVPGSYDLLDMLLRHGVTPYLASGTDEVFPADSSASSGSSRKSYTRTPAASPNWKFTMEVEKDCSGDCSILPNSKKAWKVPRVSEPFRSITPPATHSAV